MKVLDYMVIAFYGLAMLAVGRYYATRTKTSDDYLLGGFQRESNQLRLRLFWPAD